MAKQVLFIHGAGNKRHPDGSRSSCTTAETMKKYHLHILGTIKQSFHRQSFERSMVMRILSSMGCLHSLTT